MPKATLIFNLPEEAAEHTQALQAGTVLGAIQEFDNFLRSKLKYAELSETEYTVYEAVREKLFTSFSESGVSIWD